MPSSSAANPSSAELGHHMQEQVVGVVGEAALALGTPAFSKKLCQPELAEPDARAWARSGT